MSSILQLIPRVGEDALEAYQDDHGEPLRAIGPLGDLNIFVGANNCGKSRLLRRIFTMRQRQTLSVASWHPNLRAAVERFRSLWGLFPDDQSAVNFRPDAEAIEAGRKADPRLFTGQSHAEWRLGRQEVAGIGFELTDHPLDKEPRALGEQTLNPLIAARFLLQWGKSHPPPYRVDGLLDIPRVLTTLEEAVIAVEALTSAMGDSRFDLRPAVYLPTLRTPLTLRQSDDGGVPQQDLFLLTTTYHYRLRDWQEHIFTGTGLYDEVKNAAGADPDVRDRKDHFEAFLSRRFFEGRKVSLVARADNELRLVLRVGGRNERPLQHVGDGIGALIVLTYRFFMADPGTWMFVEEPETHLHPGLQRVFFEAVLDDEMVRAKNLRTFVTTHSNHLVGLALRQPSRIAVFGFERRDDGERERFRVRTMQGPDLRVLNQLGVENSSVLLANCTIWVEGSTDRKYLRAYLRERCAQQDATFKPIEDLHYAFFEYGGSNVVHYLFGDQPRDNIEDQIVAEFLSNRIFLLADQDHDNDLRHATMRDAQSTGFVYAVTSTVEIENLLSAATLTSVLPGWLGIPADDPIVIKLREAQYAQKHLGAFLAAKFKGKVSGALALKSGTLAPRYKKRLAELATAHITWETMSDPAKDLAEKLYAFIRSHNS